MNALIGRIGHLDVVWAADDLESKDILTILEVRPGDIDRALARGSGIIDGEPRFVFQAEVACRGQGAGGGAGGIDDNGIGRSEVATALQFGEGADVDIEAVGQKAGSQE